MTICNHFGIIKPSHATTSSTRPFYSPYPNSYRYSIATKSESPVIFATLGPNHIGVTLTALTFLGHVTSSVTRPFDSVLVISYWWSFETKSLSVTTRNVQIMSHNIQSNDIHGPTASD